MRNQKIKIEIGHKTILFTFFSFIAIKFFQAISGILISLFISALIATAVYPLVKYFTKFKIPRQLSASLILILIIAGLFGSFASLLPMVIAQASSLIQQFPYFIEQLGVYNIDSSVITSQFSTLPSNIFKFAIDTFSSSIFVFTIFVISFYLIMERANIDQHFRTLFGIKAEFYKKVFSEIEAKLGQWVRAEIFLMIIIGLMSYTGLILIGIDYALPLAIIAGILELIPNIGPTVSAVPAIIVGLATSPIHGILVTILYVLVQQLENSFIVPSIMRKTVDLHPVVTIIALLIGFELGGVILAVLALPIVLVAKLLIMNFYTQKQDSKIVA